MISMEMLLRYHPNVCTTHRTAFGFLILNFLYFAELTDFEGKPRKRIVDNRSAEERQRDAMDEMKKRY
jgi:hypothetical protein